jgi:YegS/Rv2252/BmrU family lipid kinase
MRVSLVVNPRSRRGRQLGSAVRDELRKRGVVIVAAHDAPVDAIVVAGGDGTVVRCIARAIHLDVPMGVVPLGTFNDLARTLNIPTDVGAACEVIAAGGTRRIDVARVNGFHYVNEASIGLSSRITRLRKSWDKQRLGLGRILVSALRGLRYVRPFTAQISCDGASLRLQTIQITVANSHHFGRIITVEDAAIDDGQLDCYAVEGEGFVPALSLIAALLRRRRPRTGAIRTFRSAAFRIVTRRRHRVTADGEPAGKTPALFEVLPGALRIFVPAP